MVQVPARRQIRNTSIQKPTDGKLAVILERDASDMLQLGLLITLGGGDDADGEILFLIRPKRWLIAARFLCPTDLNKDQIPVGPTIHNCGRPDLPVHLDHILFPA